MNRAYMIATGRAAAVALTIVLPLLSGCQNRAQTIETPETEVETGAADSEATQSTETATEIEQMDALRGKTADARPGATDAAQVESEPPIPPYLTLLDPVNAARDSKITAELKQGSAVALTTQNVARFRITRDGLPGRRFGSIPLQIDGQVFEWTGAYRAVVFEFTVNGGWRIAERIKRMP